MAILLNPQGKPATFGNDVSVGRATGRGLLDINAFLQGAQGVPPIPGVPAPAPVGAPGSPAAPHSDRLQMQRERQQFQKSIVTPRHLGMSGEELTPQNPFTSGFFTPAAERKGLQSLAPQGDIGLLAQHTDTPAVNPFVGAFNPHTEAIASRYQPQVGQVAGTPPSPAIPPPSPPPHGSDFALPTSFGGPSLEAQTSELSVPRSVPPPVQSPFNGGIMQPEPPAPLGPTHGPGYVADRSQEPYGPPAPTPFKGGIEPPAPLGPPMRTAPVGSDFALPTSLQGGPSFEAQPSNFVSGTPPFQGGVINPPAAPQPMTHGQVIMQAIRAGQAARRPPSQVSPSVGPNAYSNVF